MTLRVHDWGILNQHIFDRDGIVLYAKKGDFVQVLEVCESSDGAPFSYLVQAPNCILNVQARKLD